MGLETPASRYRQSHRAVPIAVEPPTYDVDAIVRKMSIEAPFGFQNRIFACLRAFTGRQIALRPTETDGVYHNCCRSHVIRSIDLNKTTKPVQDISEHVFAVSPVSNNAKGREQPLGGARRTVFNVAEAIRTKERRRENVKCGATGELRFYVFFE